MKHIGWFTEMGFDYEYSQSIKDCIIDKVTYDKDKIIEYLKSKKRIAGCPRAAVDCITGQEISPSFSVYSDGLYDWCDFLIYHIQNYNIDLPNEFIAHIISQVA